MRVSLKVNVVVMSETHCDNSCPFYTYLDHYKIHYCKLFSEPLQKVKTDEGFWYNLRCQQCIDKERENESTF